MILNHCAVRGECEKMAGFQSGSWAVLQSKVGCPQFTEGRSLLKMNLIYQAQKKVEILYF